MKPNSGAIISSPGEECGLGQTVTLSYDKLGRMIERVELEGTSTWTYDTATHGIGQLHTSSGAEGDVKTYHYDSLGRLVSTVTTVAEQSFTLSQNYDLEGRIDTLTYPSSPHYPAGLEVQNHYNARGYLASIQNVSTQETYWSANSQGAEGQLTQFTFGNGIQTNKAYTPQTGRVNAIGSSTPLGTNDVQDLSYTFDSLGNLVQRQDLAQGLSETFSYDALNRMTTSELFDAGVSQGAKTYSYDALGNIVSKTGTGTYNYGGAGPHAVTNVDGHNMSYDLNGNMTSGYNFTSDTVRTLSYTSYNKAKQIVQADVTMDFHHGIDRARFKQVVTDISGESIRYYIGDLYERDETGNNIVHIHYLKAGGETIGIYKSKSDNTEETRYLHRDHLGSITAISDETAQVVEELSYDPHGKRRNLDWSDAIAQIFSQETPRCFTGHQYLDDVGLIHMNGRVYDPDLGRFISADPTVQYPMNSQNFNRYYYVNNNPLSFTDPSGFGFFGGDYYRDAYDNFTDYGSFNYDFNSSIGFFAGDSYSSLDIRRRLGLRGIMSL